MKKLSLLFRRSLQEFQEDKCTLLAAAISYYVLSSLFPLLIFLVAILGLFLQSESLQQEIIDAVLDLMPLTQGEGRNEVTEAVRGILGLAAAPSECSALSAWPGPAATCLE